VINFTVQYTTGDGNWLPSWDSTQQQMNNTLPAAVQVTLELERPSAAGKMRRLRFMRTFLIPSSTAATDPIVNPGGGGL
jgi:hypothetical protein